MKEIYPSGFAPKKAHYAPGILDDDGTLYVSTTTVRSTSRDS